MTPRIPFLKKCLFQEKWNNKMSKKENVWKAQKMHFQGKGKYSGQKPSYFPGFGGILGATDVVEGKN